MGSLPSKNPQVIIKVDELTKIINSACAYSLEHGGQL